MPTIHEYARRDDARRIRPTSPLGQNLRARRLAAEMSQMTFAVVVGTTNQYISDLECSVSLPSLKMLGTLAVALSCTPSDLLEGVTAEELL